MKTDVLSARVTQYLTDTRKRRAFEKKNADVFEAYRKLEKAEKASLDAAKEAAREHAVPGETVVPVETADVRVMVIGGFRGLSYDPVRAKEHWPASSFLRVVEIDSDKVRALVKLDVMTEEVAALAVNEQEPLDPKVKIEVLGK